MTILSIDDANEAFDEIFWQIFNSLKEYNKLPETEKEQAAGYFVDEARLYLESYRELIEEARPYLQSLNDLEKTREAPSVIKIDNVLNEPETSLKPSTALEKCTKIDRIAASLIVKTKQHENYLELRDKFGITPPMTFDDVPYQLTAAVDYIADGHMVALFEHPRTHSLDLADWASSANYLLMFVDKETGAIQISAQIGVSGFIKQGEQTVIFEPDNKTDITSYGRGKITAASFDSVSMTSVTARTKLKGAETPDFNSLLSDGALTIEKVEQVRRHVQLPLELQRA